MAEQLIATLSQRLLRLLAYLTSFGSSFFPTRSSRCIRYFPALSLHLLCFLSLGIPLGDTCVQQQDHRTDIPLLRSLLGLSVEQLYIGQDTYR